jgi:hypothetical protein
MTSNLSNMFTAAARLAKSVTVSTILTAGTLAMAQNSSPILPPPPPVVSTVPANGDVNPYGVAFVGRSTLSDGVLKPGDILVSNFNNAQNLQGTGTTVIRVDTHGKVSTFFQGKPGLGLTAALGVVKVGLVFVGNLPTMDGTSATIKPTSLLVLDRKGRLLANLTDKNLIAGPWGMTILDRGTFVQVFFSNVLNGTVTRLDLAVSNDGDSFQVVHALRIAEGYNHRTDPAALVLGPSGLAYDAQHDTLFVASSADNSVYAIPEASARRDANEGTGKIIYQDNVHLHGPLDLVMTPFGHLITANSDGSNADPNQPSELVEFTVDGKFVTQFSVDPNNGGAFGIGLVNVGSAVRFAAVDDNANTLTIWAEPIY